MYNSGVYQHRYSIYVAGACIIPAIHIQTPYMYNTTVYLHGWCNYVNKRNRESEYRHTLIKLEEMENMHINICK